MVVHLSEVFNLNEFTSGRRTLALRKVRTQAQGLRFRPLVEHIDEALVYEATIRALDSRWLTRQIVPSGSVTKPIDNLADRTLTAIRDTAQAQAEGARPGEAIIGKVEAFLAAIFPHGVQAVTSLPYADELTAVEDIVAKLQGELAPMVIELGLTRLVQRLARLAAEYRTALEKDQDVLEFDTVRAARARGQDNLLGAMALIVGKYYKSDDPEHVSARNLLLGPIFEQNEAIRAYIRARRAVQDIDPDTGEVEPDGSGAEIVVPAPASNPSDALSA